MQLSRICLGTIQQKAKKKLDRSTSYQEAVEDPEEILIDPPSCREAIEIAIRRS